MSYLEAWLYFFDGDLIIFLMGDYFTDMTICILIYIHIYIFIHIYIYIYIYIYLISNTRILLLCKHVFSQFLMGVYIFVYI